MPQNPLIPDGCIFVTNLDFTIDNTTVVKGTQYITISWVKPYGSQPISYSFGIDGNTSEIFEIIEQPLYTHQFDISQLNIGIHVIRLTQYNCGNFTTYAEKTFIIRQADIICDIPIDTPCEIIDDLTFFKSIRHTNLDVIYDDTIFTIDRTKNLILKIEYLYGEQYCRKYKLFIRVQDTNVPVYESNIFQPYNCSNIENTSPKSSCDYIISSNVLNQINGNGNIEKNYNIELLQYNPDCSILKSIKYQKIIFQSDCIPVQTQPNNITINNSNNYTVIVNEVFTISWNQPVNCGTLPTIYDIVVDENTLYSNAYTTLSQTLSINSQGNHTLKIIQKNNCTLNLNNKVTQIINQQNFCQESTWINTNDNEYEQQIVSNTTFSLNCEENLNQIIGSAPISYSIKQYYNIYESNLIYDFGVKQIVNNSFIFTQQELQNLFNNYPLNYVTSHKFLIIFKIFANNCNTTMSFNKQLQKVRFGYIKPMQVQNLRLSATILYKNTQYEQLWDRPNNLIPTKVAEYVIHIKNLETNNIIYTKQYNTVISNLTFTATEQIPNTLQEGLYQLEVFALPFPDADINFKGISTFQNFTILQECQEISTNPIITAPINNCNLENTNTITTVIEWIQQTGTNVLYDVNIDGTTINNIPITDLKYNYGFYTQGEHTIKLIQKNICTYFDKFDEIKIFVYNKPNSVELTYPQDMQDEISVTPIFTWNNPNTEQNIKFDLYIGETDLTLNKIASDLIETTYIYNQQTFLSNTTYYWKVVQKNNYSESDNNNIFSFTTITCQNIPNIPIIISPENNQVGIQLNIRTFTWENSINQILYDLYFGESDIQDNELEVLQSNIEANNYTDNTILEKNKEYKWKIVQKSNCQNIQSQVYKFRILNCIGIQNEFQIIDPINDSENLQTNFRINWSDQSSIDNFVSYYSVFSGNSRENAVAIQQTENLYFDFEGVVNSEYYIFIRQVNDCGYVDSNIIRITTKQCTEPPTNLVLTYPSNGQENIGKNLIFRWEAENYVSFNLYLNTMYEFNETNKIQENIRYLNCSQLDLSINTTYYWKVVQINDCGETASQTNYFTISNCIEPPTYVIIKNPKNNYTNIDTSVTIQWEQENQISYDVFLSNMLNTLSDEKIQENIIETSFKVLSPLIPNTTYFCMIRQTNNCGEIFSDYITFVTNDCQVQPEIPILTSPITIGQPVVQPITLIWEQQQQQVLYDVYYGRNLEDLETQKYTNVIQTSLELPILDTNQVYLWKIVQKNNCGVTEVDTYQTFVTAECIEPPSEITLIEPQNYSTTVTTDSTRFYWIDSNIENKQYTLQISKSSDFNTIYHNYNNLTQNEIIVTGLEIDTQYYWKISLSNDCGRRESQIYSFKTLDCSAKPQTPTIIYPNNIENIPIYKTKFEWHKSLDQKTYAVFIKLANSSNYNKIQDNIQDTFLIYNFLLQESDYTWYIIQKNNCGETISDISNFKTVQINCFEPTKPVDPYPQNNSISISRQIRLKWKESIGDIPIKYNIYIDKNTQNPETLYTNFTYQKQDIKLISRYSYGLEVETDRLTLMSLDASPLESPERYPILQTKLLGKTSYERYFYIQQLNLREGQKLKRFKVFQDKNEPIRGLKLYFRSQSIDNYKLPKRGNWVENGMTVIQEEPYNINLTINNQIDGEITQNFETTDFGVLQLEISKNIQVSGQVKNTIFIQYDEYIPDETNTLDLEQYTTYYWKVVQENECGKVESEIWKFTTGE